MIHGTNSAFLRRIGYRVHDSNPRNEVIALAMSWTIYVEKSGSGTGEIIDKCRDHGLATGK